MLAIEGSSELPIFSYGIAGTHMTGKSSFADGLAKALEERYPNLLVLRVNYADALRQMVGESWPFFPTALEKRHPLEREVLQATGEVWRAFDSLHWVRQAQQGVLIDAQDAVILRDFKDLPDYQACITISADVYHFNEALSMNRLVLVENEEVDIAPPKPGDYQPHSIVQTNWMLRNWRTVKELLNTAGASLLRLRVKGPEQFNNKANVFAEMEALEQLINLQLGHLDRDPLELAGEDAPDTSLYTGIPDPEYLIRVPERHEDREGYSYR